MSRAITLENKRPMGHIAHLSIVAPPDPRGPGFEQTWICTMSASFHINLNFPGHVVLEEKIFKHFSYINTCINGFPYCAPPDPRGPWFEQIWICTMSASFHVNLNFSDLVVLEKKIFKHFSYINTCKNGFPYCGLARPLGAMIWT
jgi:hypothetical protein